jgi:hypothetical protein
MFLLQILNEHYIPNLIVNIFIIFEAFIIKNTNYEKIEFDFTRGYCRIYFL